MRGTLLAAVFVKGRRFGTCVHLPANSDVGFFFSPCVHCSAASNACIYAPLVSSLFAFHPLLPLFVCMHPTHVPLFALSLWLAGLVRAEETHSVQHRAAVRLERLQHQRAWNIINLEHQQAVKAAAEGPPAAVSSTGCTSADLDTTQQLKGPTGQPQLPEGIRLSDLQQLRSGLSEMRQRVVPRK